MILSAFKSLRDRFQLTNPNITQAWNKEKIWVPRRQESNSRPPKHQADALSTAATRSEFIHDRRPGILLESAHMNLAESPRSSMDRALARYLGSQWVRFASETQKFSLFYVPELKIFHLYWLMKSKHMSQICYCSIIQGYFRIFDCWTGTSLRWNLMADQQVHLTHDIFQKGSKSRRYAVAIKVITHNPTKKTKTVCNFVKRGESFQIQMKLISCKWYSPYCGDSKFLASFLPFPSILLSRE